MRRKMILSLLLSVGLALSATGCGKEEIKQSAGEDIQLIEPVNVTVNYEEAEYRNLYDAEVYSATVVPYIEEYSSEDGMVFHHYGAYPGEAVEKGDTLIHSDPEAINKKIEDMEDKIKNMEEEFQDYKAEVEEYLKEQQNRWGTLKYCVDAYENIRPEEYVDGSTVSGGVAGTQVKNPEYSSWETEYNKYIGPYRILDHEINTRKLALEQRTELYELDHAHYLKLLAELKEEKKDASIISKMTGTIVATQFCDQGNYIAKDVPVIAVGDMNQKLLKCEYINGATIKKAVDVYALIDGKRYELEYQPIESDEYVRLISQGETVYSTFTILNPEDINIGDFAVIVVVNDSRTGVLSVPKAAIHKDDTGSYVYTVEEGAKVYTAVKTGMSDGAYTEIVSGVTGGDKILVENTGKTGSSTAKVTKGSFSSSFEGRGFIQYPSSSYIKNPVENGTVYFVSSDIQAYQHVEVGDVIATVRVVSDEVALSRNETKRTRLLERINDLQKQDAEANKKSIESMKEQLSELEETIAKQKSDFATTQIRADRSGIVIWMEEFEEEDILQKGCNILGVADEDTCYVVVENPNQLLQYGNQVQIEYSGADNQTRTAQGMVANMSKIGVSSKLTTEYAMISLPKEQISDMAQSVPRDNNFWGNWYRYDVTGTIREMDNVLTVPKKAVQDINGCTYVSVVDETGKVVTQSFIAGGYNSDYYWVVDGLTEGMEVCLE